MVKVSVDNGYLRILGKSCLRIPDTWAKLSADTGYRQKAVSAPVSMDTWGSMCHPALDGLPREGCKDSRDIPRLSAA